MLVLCSEHYWSTMFHQTSEIGATWPLPRKRSDVMMTEHFSVCFGQRQTTLAAPDLLFADSNSAYSNTWLKSVA